MDIVHDFLGQKSVVSCKDYSFARFKQLWTKFRMNYLLMVRHKEEPLHYFLCDMFHYLTDRLLHEYRLPEDSQVLIVRIYCCYSMYTLYKSQAINKPDINPSANEYPTRVNLPEYLRHPLYKLIDTCSKLKEQFPTTHADPYDLIRHMWRQRIFVFCVEHPRPYNSATADPYPSRGAVDTNGTKSQYPLKLLRFVDGFNIAGIQEAEQRYKRALKRCNPSMSANEEEEPSLTDHLKQSIQENTNYLTQRKREQYSQNMPDFEAGIEVEQLTIVDQAKPLKDDIRKMFYTAADDYEIALRTPAPPIPGAEVEDSDDDVEDVELLPPKAKPAQEKKNEEKPAAIVKQEIVKEELFQNTNNDLPPLLPGINAQDGPLKQNADLQSLFSHNNLPDSVLDSDSEKEEEHDDIKSQPLAITISPSKDSTTTIPPPIREGPAEVEQGVAFTKVEPVKVKAEPGRDDDENTSSTSEEEEEDELDKELADILEI